jgi:hypothetical protein
MINPSDQIIDVLDSARVNRLMFYYDRRFIELTYRAVLDREADPSGVDHFLRLLRDGESRREIVYKIATSDEAKSRGVSTDAFRHYPLWRRLQGVPFLGALIILVIGLIRIKAVVREFRRVQNAVYGVFQEYQ